MVAVVAADAGKPVFEVAAVQELAHDLWDDWAQVAVTGLKALLVADEKVVEMLVQALPERRSLWLSNR